MKGGSPYFEPRFSVVRRAEATERGADGVSLFHWVITQDPSIVRHHFFGEELQMFQLPKG